MSVQSKNSAQDSLQYIGPYENWIYGNGKPYAAASIRQDDYKFLSAIVELPVPATADVIQKALNSDSTTKGKAWLPEIWRSGSETYKFLPLLVSAELGFLGLDPNSLNGLLAALAAAISQALQLVAISSDGSQASAPQIRFRVNVPVAEASINQNFDPSSVSSPERQPPPKKPLVIMAVVDNGLPFAHRCLLDSKKKSTRIEYCWLQDGVAPNATNILFGKELTGKDIDSLRQAYPDEDILYQMSSSPPPDREHGNLLTQIMNHGSHVLGQAAGDYCPFVRYDDIDQVRVIAVQLPNDGLLDTSGFGKDAHVLSAFHYILDRADKIAAAYNDRAPLPLIINYSYGYTGGPHYGRDRLESAIEDLILKRRAVAPTALVMPSGNSFTSALHGALTEQLFEDDQFAIPWRIQPNDRGSNYLELWFPEEAEISKYSIEVHDPSGKLIAQMARPAPRSDGGTDAPQQIAPISSSPDSDAIGQISVDQFRSERWRALIALAPTEPFNEASPATEAGLWQVVVKREPGTTTEGPIQCRIQRNADTLGYFSGSRQSYFDDWRDLPYDGSGKLAQTDVSEAFVRRFGTINGIATHNAVTLTAGCYALTGAAVPYSSAGNAPADERNRKHDAQVLCSAASDRAPAIPGVLGPGTRSGSYFALTGTSAAAPLVARQLAVQFLKNPYIPPTVNNYLDLLPGSNIVLPDEIRRLGTKRVESVGKDFSG